MSDYTKTIDKVNRDRISGCEIHVRTELDGNEVTIFVNGFMNEGEIKCTKETAKDIVEMLSDLL